MFVNGDNPERSGDSRQQGTMPIKAIWGMTIWEWGLDGCYWIDHNKKTWEENRSIYLLTPGQNSPPPPPRLDTSQAT